MKRSPIKLVAIDLDGTLLDSDYRISALNRLAVADLRAAGIQVVPATGRRFGIGASFAESLGLDGFMICQNGAVIKWLGNRSTVWHQGLSTDLTRRVVGEGYRFDFSPIVFHDPREAGRVLVEDGPFRHDRLERYLLKSWDDVQLVPRLIDLLPGDILQVMFCDGVASIRWLAGHLGRVLNGDVTLLLTEYPHRDLGILDVMHWNVSKGRALDRVAALSGVDRDEVAAIGDNHNDREMLEIAGLPMVMNNARDELKADFPRVLPTSDCSGVAWGIWTHVLPRPDRIAQWTSREESGREDVRPEAAGNPLPPR